VAVADPAAVIALKAAVGEVLAPKAVEAAPEARAVMKAGV
jgi:hypothetical protein